MHKLTQLENRVLAVLIWGLSTGNSYRSVAKVFGLGKSTVIKIVKQGVAALRNISPDVTHFPASGRETAIAISAFKEYTYCKIPNVVCTIDGMHVEILAPGSDSKRDYFSRKQKYNVTIQAIVGANLLFLDVAIGFPDAGVHDARMLRSSTIYNISENEELITELKHLLDDAIIQSIILGDGDYQQTSWILKPYPNNIRLKKKSELPVFFLFSLLGL